MILTIYCEHMKRNSVLDQLRNMGIVAHTDPRSPNALTAHGSEAQRDDISRMPEVRIIAWRKEVDKENGEE